MKQVSEVNAVKVYEVAIGKRVGATEVVVRQVRGLAPSESAALEQGRPFVDLGQCILSVKGLYELDWDVQP